MNIEQLQKSVDNKREQNDNNMDSSSEEESGLLGLLISWHLNVFIYRQKTGLTFMLEACILEVNRFERELRVTGLSLIEYDLVWSSDKDSVIPLCISKGI